MRRFTASVSVLAVLAAVGLAGCGGGGGSAPVAPPAINSAQQVFVLDFVHHTVTTAVQPQYVERNPGQAAADLALTITFPPADPGNPGREQITAKVKNNTTGPVGANDQGTITGLDLCFLKTVFKNAGGAVVTGGGYGGYASLNPLDGTPVFHTPGSLAPGVTSAGALVSLLLPPTATTATVTVLVRADTVFVNPPDLTRWYLTTLTGHSAIPGFQDGSAAQALFNGVQSTLVREDQGDLLIADHNSNRIRRLYQGQVRTFAGDGRSSVCNQPFGLGQDSAGNVYLSEYSCVSFTPSGGGNPTIIAGDRGLAIDDNVDRPGDLARFYTLRGLAVSSDHVFVCDYDKVKMLSYSGTGARTDPAAWWVRNITYGAGFSGPAGVATDAAGNVFVVDSGTNQVYAMPFGGSGWAVIAGSGAAGETNGTGLAASFNQPVGLAVDQAGDLYVADDYGSLRRLRHTGGSLTDPTTWKIETLVHSAAAPKDGFTGTGKVCNLRGVSCARDGTLYLAEGNEICRLDRTRN